MAEEPEKSRGALSGRTMAHAVNVDGIVEPGFRPGQGASNPDWNSSENNLGMYRDPAEVAWERQERANQMSAAEQPEQTAAAGTEASTENGSAQVQQPSVPKRGRGRPKGSSKNANSGKGRSVDVPVSGVSRSRDANEDQLQAVRQPPAHRGREVAEKRGDLKIPPGGVTTVPKNGHPDGWDEAQRNQAILGFSAFSRYIQEAPLSAAVSMFNEFSRKIIDCGNAIEARRHEEKKSENSCKFCDHEFSYRGNDFPKGRRAFDLPNGIMEVVITCSKTRCIEAFEEYVNDMSLRSRETLHE